MKNVESRFLLLLAFMFATVYSAEKPPAQLKDELTISGKESVDEIKKIVYRYGVEKVKTFKLMMGMNVLQFFAASSKCCQALDFLISIGFDKNTIDPKYGDLLQIAARMNPNINMITHLLVNHRFNEKEYTQSLDSLAKHNKNKIIAIFLKDFEKKSMQKVEMVYHYSS